MAKYVIFDDGKNGFDADPLDAEIELVRRRIGDGRRFDTIKIIGDGEETLFSLPNTNVFSVYVRDGEDLVPDSMFDVNSEAGKVVFYEPVALNTKYTITFGFAAFTDDQLQTMINMYGIEGAVIECLNGLLSDSARFYDYSQGQTSDKRSQIFDHLKDMLATAKAELAASTTSDLAIGNRNTGRRGKRYALDLTRDDTFSTPVDGYSSNNV